MASTIEVTRAAAMPRPPRSMAWTLLVAATGAVALTGAATTALVLSQRASTAVTLPPAFWIGLVAVGALTLVSLGVRSLRWIFLLRRVEARVPIRDAYIGYFSGFALLLAPLLLGEIVLRARVLKRRGGVPTGVTAALNLWERGLDLLALAVITAASAVTVGARAPLAFALVVVGMALCAHPVRSLAAQAVVAIVNGVGGWVGMRVVPPLPRLADARTWMVALATSAVAWAISAVALYLALLPWEQAGGLADAVWMSSSATLSAGVSLAPGGVVVWGRELLVGLDRLGLAAGVAPLVALGLRVMTAGVATAFGLVFLLIHSRTSRVVGSATGIATATTADHFDTIADAYDVQIPRARRQALVSAKTAMMDEWLARLGGGRQGLDVGCGQGWYIQRMRALGYDVTGIDTSAGQVALAARHLGEPRLAHVGSALSIPLVDGSVDFAYTVNVLHHLPSVASQRLAFAEILRVLRPGGVLFLHEINTTNPLFRFYMGYVFPSLNCIDEGIERWLLPSRLSEYTPARVEEIRYFTFLPDFTPAWVMRALGPIERRLERSRLRRFSAHYMAVLRKPE